MKMVQLPFIAIFVTATLTSVLAYQSHYGPSGVTYYDKAKSYGGYTLFTPLRPGPAPEFPNNATYLIDMEGNVVKTWTLPKYELHHREAHVPARERQPDPADQQRHVGARVAEHAGRAPTRRRRQPMPLGYKNSTGMATFSTKSPTSALATPTITIS